MQGFFIHVSNGSWPVTGTLAMNNSVRITDLTHPFSKSKGTNQVPFLRLNVSFSDDTTSIDPLLIYYDYKASDEFDKQLDALKLFNTDLNVPNIYALTPSSEKLSISALPLITTDSTKVPVGLKLNRSGNIIFRIQDIDESLKRMRVYLTDVLTGTEQDLLPDYEYNVHLTNGEYNNRFFINLSAISTDIQDNSQNNEPFSVYFSEGILKTEINILNGEDGTITISNLLGQTLFNEKVYETGYHEFNPRLKYGIYIVSFRSGISISSIKMLIPNR